MHNHAGVYRNEQLLKEGCDKMTEVATHLDENLLVGLLPPSLPPPLLPSLLLFLPPSSSSLPASSFSSFPPPVPPSLLLFLPPPLPPSLPFPPCLSTSCVCMIAQYNTVSPELSNTC